MIKSNIITITKVLLIEVAVTIILSLVAAFIAYKFHAGDMAYKIMVIMVYALATFFGGIIIGKEKQYKKFLWGMLAGGLYILIIALTSIIVTGSIDGENVKIISAVITCLAGGTIGGMIG